MENTLSEAAKRMPEYKQLINDALKSKPTTNR
jgi:hypothetical protein